MSHTVGEALPNEMIRVLNEVMPAYEEIGPEGRFALALMRSALVAACRALAAADVAAMIVALEDLKGFNT